MYKSFRTITEKGIIVKENIEEKIASIKGEYTLRVPILMYHHIGIPPANEIRPQLYVHPDLFRQEMEYLAKNKYKTITLENLTSALMHHKKLPNKSIVLTFDDGYIDFYTIVFPILKKNYIKSTLFISTDNINKPNYLSLHQLQSLLKSKIVTIGSHTVSHLDLTRLNENRLVFELIKSKTWFLNKLKVQISSIAYPIGKYNKKIIFETQKSGYTNAVITNYGYLHNEKGAYNLKRIRIGNNIILSDFIRRISIEN
ncbi:polysaccharide deacetylase family protein [Patescibacteria group bacterium]|nr:polysaccharide deacetylase family protein [Patescibacteria group bacterium]